MMTSAVLLSVWMVIIGCGWPSSPSVLHMVTAVFAFLNNAPSSSSATYNIRLQIIVDWFSTVPLFGRCSLLLDRKWWPPLRLQK